MEKKEVDFLQGSFGRKLISFAIPLAITGIVQQLFNAADVAMIGWYGGKEAMAAVGSNSPVTGFLLNLFMGISLGATIVLSQYIGKGDKERISRAVHTVLLTAVASGLLAVLLGEAIAAPLLHSLSVEEDIWDKALLYLRLYVGGMPFLVFYNFAAGLFRGRGDAKKPLICMLVMGVLKLTLNYLFLAFAGLEVTGVALSTILSNALGAAMLFWFLKRETTLFRLKKESLRIDKGVLVEIVRIGLPAGIQMVVASLSTMLLQSAINSLGVDVVVASSAAFQLELVVYYLLNAFGQACATFVGQNYGAGNLERCKKGIRLVLLQNLAFTMTLAGLILCFGKPLLAIFHNDPAVIALGMERLKIVLLAEGLNVLMEVLSAAMRGYGNSALPAVITLLGICGVRIYWVYVVFQQHNNFAALMWVFPVSWFVICVALLLAYWLYGKQKKSLQAYG